MKPQEYRQSLAKEVREESDKAKRRELLTRARDSAEYRSAKTFREMKRLCMVVLAPYPDGQRLAVQTHFLDREVIVDTAQALRRAVAHMDDPAQGLAGGRPHHVIILKVDPEPNFAEQWQLAAASRVERTFTELRRECLESLQSYEDFDRVVFDLVFPGCPPENRPAEITVGELRSHINSMSDVENPLGYGSAFDVRILSDEPDRYWKEMNGKLARAREGYLRELDRYDDEQILWYCYANSLYFNSEGVMQTTAKELRANVRNFTSDLEQLEMLNHMGGIRIISADPNFDADAFIQKSAEQTQELISFTIATVNAQLALRNELLGSVEDMQGEEAVMVRMPGGAVRQIPVGEYRAIVSSLPLEELLSDGFRVVGSAGPKEGN